MVEGPAATMAAQRARVRGAIEPGLIRGWGSMRPGDTCLQGAVAYGLDFEPQMRAVGGDPALGTRLDPPHPPAVASADWMWGLAINEALECDPAERARLLLPIGLAQVGTGGEDRSGWAEDVLIGTVQDVLPPAIRVLKLATLAAHADACAEADTVSAAHRALDAAFAAVVFVEGLEVRAETPYEIRREIRDGKRPVRDDVFCLISALTTLRGAVVHWSCDYPWPAAGSSAVAARFLADNQACVRAAIDVAKAAYAAEGRLVEETSD